MGCWVEGISKIFQVVVDHFSNHFRESYDDRPRLDEVSFRSIFEEKNANLTTLFLLIEIDRVIAL